MGTDFPFGYTGRVLSADFSRGALEIQELSEELAREYLGGNGFCARLLYDMTGPETEPLGSENVLIFAVGPLTGTNWPQTGRYEVAAKSPLTGIYGEANSGGHWGSGLKHAGFDLIVMEGKSEKPVYLLLEDGEAYLEEAESFWGSTVRETSEQLAKRHDVDKRKVVCIGPGGEKLVRFAAIMTGDFRAAARSGLGAVMGSKNLKAIVVKGDQRVELADPESFKEVALEARKKIVNHKFTPDSHKYGTTLLIELMNEIGRLPTRNFQAGVFDGADDIGGEKIVQEYKVEDRGCYGCPIRCENYTRVPEGKYKSSGKVEYETLSSFGSRCGNDNIESILYANQLCNDYGLDTISCGGVIGFAMECYEKGILTEEDTDGLELEWGNEEAIIELVERIIDREGLGDELAEGIGRFSESLGEEAGQYVMAVKGQDIPAQDSRAQKSMGLAHATANRGADHLTAFETLSEVGFNKGIEKRFGEEVLPEAADRLNPMYKPLMVRDGENFCAVVDSVTVCKFGTIWPPTLYFQEIAEGLSAATGIDYSEKDLRRIGERIFTLERIYDIREGITKEDDVLPRRLTEEPAPKGPCEGEVVELEQMRSEYYNLRGWDQETGLIPSKKLEELGLGEEAAELERLGKLP